ncbi:hypothetical protein [Methanobrevibacter sp.]|uniref:hypothetical protein n=1 Tax=Methanobrevibacter sp. TaxID=66852 RepID=UPI00388F409B
MRIQGKNVDPQLARIEKSIAKNLQNKNLFQSENKDVAENVTELHPPIPMESCLYVFQKSSHVAKCCRILADDIIYNDITLTPNTIDEPSDKLVNQVKKINEFLEENIDEIHNMAIDYNYAAWAAVEYIWNNVRFKLKQIPIHSCKIIRTTIKDQQVYLLKQLINSKTKYFKIMGENYPENFIYYDNQKLGHASLLGGDNIYQFFGLPRWIQNYEKILTEIAISKSDYKTVSNGNISSGVLNINLEPQPVNPIQYDSEGNPVIQQESREEIISKELSSANGGTAVIFTESNRPLNMDYVTLTNNNQSYLSDLGDKCQQAVLNDYNIPLVRLMINTERESMNSDKTKSIWEIYTLNLRNEQKPFKQWICELIDELYSIDVNVDISTPIFSDRREIEVKLISDAWNNGALTLKQYITGLAEHISVIDLNEYDFTTNPHIWEYRKLPELEAGLSEDDLRLIEEVEAQLKEA